MASTGQELAQLQLCLTSMAICTASAAKIAVALALTAVGAPATTPRVPRSFSNIGS